MAALASSSRNTRVPLTPVREHYLSVVMATAVNALPKQSDASLDDEAIMISLQQHADRVFPGGFVVNTHNSNAKFSKEGMRQIMMMSKIDEAL